MPLPDGRPTAVERATAMATGSPGQGYGDSRYQLSPTAFAHAKGMAVAASRRERRKALALAAQVTYLAVMDPESGASTQDRLKAADGAARVSGLVREGSDTKVSLIVTFKGLRRSVVDADAIEARVVEAAGLPPLAGNGAAGRVEGGGGEGG